MDDQKIENLLNLALDSTQEEREKSENLDTGYDAEKQTWEVIVRYSGDLRTAAPQNWKMVFLTGGYAIITLPQDEVKVLAALPQIEYIEKSKRMYFQVDAGKRASCILPLQTGEMGLFGEGILIGILDSGVDYFHSDFRNEDGTTRILNIWDQTVNSGTPPEGFYQGTEFIRDQINEALATGSRPSGYNIVSSVDNSGHGTAVLGIAAGNGNASGGRYAGVAPASDILVVKLGLPGERGFPSTTQLMQGLEYVIRKAEEYGKPVAVNLSFGNVYGSHAGTSLLETYMNGMAGVWKNVIAVGAGNEGTGYGHTSGQFKDDQVEIIELSVSEFEATINVQLWKNYADEFDITLVHPSGQRITLSALEVLPSGQSEGGTSRYRLGQTDLLIYYGVPSPYSINQEIYLDFLPVGTNSYIDAGIWRIELTPRRIVAGVFDLWLPGGGALNQSTRFLRPSPQVTLTIPSTAEKVISVGAYDADTMSYASFSGRGFTRYPEKIKPDLAAPGVGITTTAVGGGYASYTGTSFATPFVTGAAALLMQWGEGGIIRLRQKSEEISGYPGWGVPGVLDREFLKSQIRTSGSP